MSEPFQQSLPGELDSIEVACSWAAAVVQSVRPGLRAITLRVVRQLVTDAVAHTPTGDRVHLRIIPAESALKIEVRDSGARMSVGPVAATSAWADISREVFLFGTRQINGQGHLVWVVLREDDADVRS